MFRSLLDIISEIYWSLYHKRTFCLKIIENQGDRPKRAGFVKTWFAPGLGPARFATNFDSKSNQPIFLWFLIHFGESKIQVRVTFRQLSEKAGFNGRRSQSRSKILLLRSKWCPRVSFFEKRVLSSPRSEISVKTTNFNLYNRLLRPQTPIFGTYSTSSFIWVKNIFSKKESKWQVLYQSPI